LTIRLNDPQEFKKLLMKKGFTYRSFAKKAGITSAHVSLIANNKRNPTPATAKKIYEALDLTFDDIFFIQSDN
jgi:transcriptional regulator with XRE-family HTH domain